ncbi:MAG: DUF4262 domain-containing protein [Planctomycetota bacterium]
MRKPTDDLSEYHKHLLETVAEHGVHITYVAPASGRGAGMAFTVGLWEKYEQPEVVVFGLEPDGAHDLLNAIADECAEDRRFADGEKHDDLLVGYSVRFVAVPPEQVVEHCHGMTWAYEDKPVPCVQLVWPDKNRRWPWQEGVREGFRKVQPVLGNVPS